MHDNLGTLVGAGIDTIWVQDLPAAVAVLMAVRLTAMADELGPDHPHTARNIVRDPSGEAISDVSGEFRAELPGARADWLTGLILPTLIQFQAMEEGAYAFEHIVDGGSPSIVPLHIIQGLPPGAAQPEG